MACDFDPRPLAGMPIGMFHCPACGEMVLAGVAHPPSLDELLAGYCWECECYGVCKCQFTVTTDSAEGGFVS